MDIPPTKRKAQNREAQRAFRERKAARIGELEEQLRSTEKQDKEEQDALRGQIARLEKALEESRKSVDFWVERCQELESRSGHEKATTNDQYPSPDVVSPSGLTSSDPAPNQPQDITRHAAGESLGCGQCSSISDCQCIQAVINMPMPDSDPDALETDSCSHKRPISPANKDPTFKRAKAEQSFELETDFTAAFSSQHHDPSSGDDHASPSSTVTDPCGFCRDGTACICAEMQAAEAIDSIANHHSQALSQDQNRRQPTAGEPSTNTTIVPTTVLPRISELSRMTPPLSETDVSLPILQQNPLPAPTTITTTGCLDGPGTCLQCQSDPNSTLFCKLLAKSRWQQQQQQQQQQPSDPSPGSPPTGCCGGTACRTIKPGLHQTPSLRAPHMSVQEKGKARGNDPHCVTRPMTISCADAYTTLSRHPGFGRAMDSAQEMSSWLPRLHAFSVADPAGDAPAGATIRDQGGKDGAGASQGRPALEMDAAEVMATIRVFDRRYT